MKKTDYYSGAMTKYSKPKSKQEAIAKGIK